MIMPLRKQVVGFFVVFIFFSTHYVIAAEKSPCEPVNKKQVKIEAWVAKRFKKEKKAIKKELGSLGNTKVMLRVFPMKEPAHVVAIGRCVPANIGRHALKSAIKYAGGVESLVYQVVFSDHWVGIGTMAFDEYSQSTITARQLNDLLDESLDTFAFQKLLKDYSLPGETIKVFGAQVPNVRRSGIDPPLRNR
tara:strand:+ start:5007 stop:5582 length:576 start_codon:yes stop_codon:yes gene_type:complete